MITSDSLKTALNTIFFGTDVTKYKFIVPIKGGFFVPLLIKENDEDTHHNSTWIGYRILEIDARLRMYKMDNHVNKSVKIEFRITSIGPKAEEFITSTMLWEDRTDVKIAFEKVQNSQIMYDRRRIYTSPIQQEGFGDDLVWVTDMNAMSFMDQEITATPWFARSTTGG